MTRKNAKQQLIGYRYLPSRVERALNDARAFGASSIGQHRVTWSGSTGYQVRGK